MPASNWGTASDSLSENWHPANQSGLPLSRELSPPDLRLPTGGRALQTEWIKHPVVSRLPVGLVLASSACIGLLLLFLRLQPDSNPAKQRASSHLATPQLASAEIQTTSEPEPAPTSNRRPNPRHESPGGSNAAVHRPAMEMLPEELPGPPPLPAEFTAGEDPPMQMPESAEEASTEEASAEGDSTEEASEGQGRDDQDRDDQVSDDETVQGETAQDEMEVQGEVARGFRIENPVTRASVPIGENIQISKAVCHAILAFDDEASDPTADPNAGPTAGPNSGGRSYLLHPEAEQRIVGKGRQVWTLTHWEEEVELLLGLESNPSRKWGIVLRVGARLGPGEPLVLASPPIAQEKLTNLAQFSTTVEHRLRQLDAMRDGLIPRGKVNLTESRRQFNAQAKELETALERWRAVSELCEIAFAKLEFKLRFREE